MKRHLSWVLGIILFSAVAYGVRYEEVITKTLQLTDGSLANPSLSNVGDTNTGIYFPAENTVGIVGGGLEDGRFFNAQLLMSTLGSHILPSYSFLGDTDLGMYRIGADTIGLSTNGAARFSLSDSNATFDFSGSVTADSKLAFEVKGITTRAAKPAPSLTTTQRDNIASPATGSMIYNSTTGRYEFYDGDSWESMAGSLLNVVTKNADYVATTSDNVILYTVASSNKLLTLPTAVGNKGVEILVKLVSLTGSFRLNIATTNSQTIDGQLIHELRAQDEWVKLISDNSNWKIVAAQYFEVVSSATAGTAALTTPLTQGAWDDITSITLRPGSWVISGAWQFTNSAALTGAINLQTAVTPHAGNVTTGMNLGSTYKIIRSEDGSGHGYTVSFSDIHASLNSPTTYYLKYRTASATTNVAYAYHLTARRYK